MTCTEYLQFLSDYRDGRMTDRRLARRLDVHLRRCARCCRHFEALDEGLGALRGLDGIHPSHTFRHRLERRLAGEVSLGDPVRPTNAGLAAAFLLAAALGLFVYEGFASPELEVALAAEPRDPGRAAQFTTPPVPAEPVDVTLPAFAHTTLEFHSAHAPLGVAIAFGR